MFFDSIFLLLLGYCCDILSMGDRISCSSTLGFSDTAAMVNTVRVIRVISYDLCTQNFVIMLTLTRFTRVAQNLSSYELNHNIKACQPF